MKRFFPVGLLVAVISLSLNMAFWQGMAAAAAIPRITWLNELSGGSLASPRAIDVDGQGNLYVADQLARAVLKYDRYGRFVGSFLNDQASGKGVAVTPDGQTLYASTKSSSVAIVNVADGTVTGYLSGANLIAPGRIDLDSGGYIFVADNGAEQSNVKIFFPNGTFKTAFGGNGTANGQFKSIADLVVNTHAERVFAASNLAELPRLQVFDLNGTYLSSVTNAFLYGTDNHSARGIAFEERADGRAFVLRYLPIALRVFDGSLSTLLGDFGTVSGKLTAPVDAAFDPTTNRLFVSDNTGIDIFGIDGGAAPVYVNHAPGVPVPTSPAAGSVVSSESPTLTWSASTDADGDRLTYEVVVKQGAGSVYTATTAATSLVVPSKTLAENGSFTWTVRASDGEATSDWSTAAAFVVNAVDEAPSVPVAVSPLAGETLGDEGALQWNPSVDPDSNDSLLTYRVEIAKDEAFAEPMATEGLTATSVPLTELAGYADLEVGATYFWRVQALDGDGTASLPSVAGSFRYSVPVLQVTANVSGAQVFLYGNHGFAGQYLGEAPLEWRNPAAGNFSVVVERAGFEPFVTQVTLAEGAGADINATLMPACVPAGYANGRVNLPVKSVASANASPFLIDFDSDGQLDLLVGDYSGQVNLLQALGVNRNDLSFQKVTRLALPILPGAVPFVADWNNDGRNDLLIGLTDGTVKLFLNDGTNVAPVFAGGFELTAGGSVLNVGNGASPAVIDLNGDGAKDLVVGSRVGAVVAYLNQGSDAEPQLATGTELFLASGATQIVPVDWDADGDRDLLVTVNGVPTVYRNDQSIGGGFTLAARLQFNRAFGLVAVDVNGGSGKDLIIGQTDGKLDYKPGAATQYAAAAYAYLQTAWNESSLQVTAENPALTQQTRVVSSQLADGNLDAAKTTVLSIANKLAPGKAKAAVDAFAVLLPEKKNEGGELLELVREVVDTIGEALTDARNDQLSGGGSSPAGNVATNNSTSSLVTVDANTATAGNYLQSEWERIMLLVAAENPRSLPQADLVEAFLKDGKYRLARSTALLMAMGLNNGEAKSAIVAFADQLK